MNAPEDTISTLQEPTDLGLTASIVDDLFRKAGAGRWALTREEFAEVLTTSVRRAFPTAKPSRRELDQYLAGVHLADLALANACALGRDVAWDHFVLEQRPVLYRSADALDPTGAARELADSLYAELYGLGGKGEERRSLFRYFHGRSSLATWLRAVLAQRYVDALRSRRRTEPLPDEDIRSTGAGTTSDPDRAQLVPLVDEALKSAIDALAAKDRLRLRSYYVTQLTLAEIGRVTGEHEATVSRHLSRTRRGLREHAERHLRETARLSDAQIARAFELALEDPGALDLKQVFERSAERKEPSPDRSNEER